MGHYWAGFGIMLHAGAGVAMTFGSILWIDRYTGGGYEPLGLFTLGFFTIIAELALCIALPEKYWENKKKKYLVSIATPPRVVLYPIFNGGKQVDL